jgi:phospholipid/cholesterol/gamma-HCH transport system substrate-binding protein
VLAVAVLIVAVAAVAALLLGGGGTGYEVHAKVENAGQLVKGNLVKVGGATIGTVSSIDLDSHNAADLTLEITDDDFAPLHRGTKATIRNTSLSAVAGRQVSLAPGRNDAPKIPDGGVIPMEDTEGIVELDSVLNTLDAETRSALQGVVHDSAQIYASGTPAANAALARLNPALAQTAALTDQLMRDRRTFERVIVESAQVVGAVASRRADLEGGIAHAATAAQAVAREAGSLDSTLSHAPATLRRANTTLVNLRATLQDLRPTIRDAQPAAPRLARLLKVLAPLSEKSRPVVRDTAAMLPDAATVLRGLPHLDTTSRRLISATLDVLDQAREIVPAVRAYTPDIIAGFIEGFGGTTGGYYDANGHYARIAFEGGPFSLAGGASVVPLPPSHDGLSGYRKGLTSRCPGAAAQPAPDKSNPFKTKDTGCRLEDTSR